MKERIEMVLEAVRPMLARHKGNIEFVGVDEVTGVVQVKFLGTCQGCPLSNMTLKGGIEEIMKEQIPGVTAVEAV